MADQSTKVTASKIARENIKPRKKSPARKKPNQRKVSAKSNSPVQPSKAKKSQIIPPDNVQEHINQIMNVDKKMRGKRKWLYEFLHRYFDPQLVGIENINKQRPTLFVANHSLLGFDGAIAPLEILANTGILPRLFTDGRGMAGPLEDFVIELGQVWADPQVCDTLMEEGENLMVFPGGYREGTKKRGELYKLLWEGRTGFVKMAIKHGYTITPFGTVGLDDAWDILWDRDDVIGTRFDKFMEWAIPDTWDSEMFPPIPRGLGWTIFPRPERCYIAFGEPIDMRPYSGKENNQPVLTRIKDQVQLEVDSLIKESMLIRTRKRYNMGWLRKRFARL